MYRKNLKISDALDFLQPHFYISFTKEMVTKKENRYFYVFQILKYVYIWMSCVLIGFPVSRVCFQHFWTETAYHELKLSKIPTNNKQNLTYCFKIRDTQKLEVAQGRD